MRDALMRAFCMIDVFVCVACATSNGVRNLRSRSLRNRQVWRIRILHNLHNLRNLHNLHKHHDQEQGRSIQLYWRWVRLQ